MKWISGDGRTAVELIRITDPGTGGEVERLRIKRDGYFVGGVRGWEDAARLGLDIADVRGHSNAARSAGESQQGGRPTTGKPRAVPKSACVPRTLTLVLSLGGRSIVTARSTFARRALTSHYGWHNRCEDRSDWAQRAGGGRPI